MTEQKAIYDEMINSIITLTKQAKAAGFTGKQIWENVIFAIVNMTSVPEGIAAFMVREAWEKAAA